MNDDLQALFELSQDLLCVANTEGYFIRVNPRFSEMLGYTETELLEKPFVEFVHPEDRELTLAELQKLAEGQPTIDFSNRYQKKDGTYIWLQWTATPRDGKIYASARNITDTKELLTALSEEKERFLKLSKLYEFATRSAGIGVWDWDVTSDALTWNDQMYELYNLRKEDFGGAYDAWQSTIDESDKGRVDKDIQAALSGVRKYDTEFRVGIGDGSFRCIRAYGSVERDEAGKPLHMRGVNWDVTKERDLELARTNFVSFASHQLRTPLTGIRWVADQLLNEELTDLGKTHLNDIREAASKLARLVDLFIGTSRIEGGHLRISAETFDFVCFLDELISEMRLSTLQKRILITKESCPLALEVNTDSYILQNVLHSIVANAIEYTLEDGTIRINVVDKDDRFEISVADSGIGIPEEDRETIFAQFTRGSNAKAMKNNGTGLGLYIAKQSTELLGGNIWFDSEVGRGTTFYIELPKKYSS